jgi:hypothetical protein
MNDSTEFVDQSEDESVFTIIQYINGQTNIHEIALETFKTWEPDDFEKYVKSLFQNQNYFPQKVGFKFAILVKEL